MSLHRQVMLDAPSGYWPLEDLAGPALDVSGNGRSLTVEAGVTPGAATVVPGRPRSMDFLGSGASNGLTTSDAAWQSPHAGANGKMTLECWFIPDTVNTIMALARKGATSNWEYAFVTSASGALNFLTFTLDGTTVTNVISANGVLTIGKLCHAVAVYDQAADFARIYLNGVQVATGTTGADTSDGTAPIYIGVRQDDTQHFNGRMGHVVLYPTALTLDRIKAHYEAGLRGGVVLGPGGYGTSRYGTTSYAGGSGNQTSSAPIVGGQGTSSVDVTSAATGRVVFKATATADVTVTSEATATFKISGLAWTADETQGLFVSFSSAASGRVDVPASSPTSPFVISDAETTSGSNIVTSDTGGFTPDDVGRPISGPGIPPNTTITSVIDGHTITMSNVASATSSGAEVTVTRSLIKIVPIWRRSVTMPNPVLDSSGRPV